MKRLYYRYRARFENFRLRIFLALFRWHVGKKADVAAIRERRKQRQAILETRARWREAYGPPAGD